MKYLLFLIPFLLQAQGWRIIVDDGVSYEAETLAYQTRVEADGGTVVDIDAVNDAYVYAKSILGLDSVRCWVGANYAVKLSGSTILKLYDLSSHNNDAIRNSSEVVTWYADSLDGLPAFKTVPNNLLKINDDGTNLDFGQGTFYVHTLMEYQQAEGYLVFMSKNTAGGAEDNIRLWFGPDQMTIAWGSDAELYNVANMSYAPYTKSYLMWGVNSATPVDAYKLNATTGGGAITLSGTGSNADPMTIGGQTGASYGQYLIGEIIVTTKDSDFKTFLNTKYGL